MQPRRGALVHDHRQQAVLQGVAAEDIRDLGADHGAESRNPGAPRARARARSRSRSCGRPPVSAQPAAAGLIEDEVGVGRAVGQVAPVGEQLLAQALLGGGGQESRRDDLIGVDVGERQRPRFASGRLRSGCITRNSRGSVIRPRTALAAAVSGLASRVRAPTPCRPSKLRLLVLSEYWPGADRVAVHAQGTWSSRTRASRRRPLETPRRVPPPRRRA